MKYFEVEVGITVENVIVNSFSFLLFKLFHCIPASSVLEAATLANGHALF